MDEAGIKRDAVTYEVLIRISCTPSHPQYGLKWVKEMKRKGFEPSLDTWTILLTRLVHYGTAELLNNVRNCLQCKTSNCNQSALSYSIDCVKIQGTVFPFVLYSTVEVTHLACLCKNFARLAFMSNGVEWNVSISFCAQCECCASQGLDLMDSEQKIHFSNMLTNKMDTV